MLNCYTLFTYLLYKHTHTTCIISYNVATVVATWRLSLVTWRQQVRGGRRGFDVAPRAVWVRTAPTATTRDRTRRPVDDRSVAVSRGTSTAPRPPAQARPQRPGTLGLLAAARLNCRPSTMPGQDRLRSPPNLVVRPTAELSNLLLRSQ